MSVNTRIDQTMEHDNHRDIRMESHIIFSIIYTLTYNNEPVPLCFISIIYILYTHVSNGPL